MIFNQAKKKDFLNNNIINKIKKNIDNFIEGYRGESFVRYLLKEKKIKFFEPDLIIEIKGEYYILEIKVQEHFESPPFDGHGLPLWQIKDRLSFCKKSNCKCLLVIIDINNNSIFYQDLKLLYSYYHNKDKCKQTTGSKPRCIFNLDLFIKEELL